MFSLVELALTRTLLTLPLVHLHELLEGRLCVRELICFRPHTSPLLRSLDQLYLGAGLVCSDDPLRGLVLRLRPYALLVAVFNVVDELQLGFLTKGRQLLKGVPLGLLLHK